MNADQQQVKYGDVLLRAHFLSCGTARLLWSKFSGAYPSISIGEQSNRDQMSRLGSVVFCILTVFVYACLIAKGVWCRPHILTLSFVIHVY